MEFSGCRVAAQGSRLSKNTTKIQRRDSQESEERKKIAAGEGKNATFWALRRRRSGRGRSCGGGLGEHPNLGRTHENLEHTPHTTHLTQPTTPQHHNTTQHNTRKSTIWANWLKSNWPKSSKKKYGHTKIGLSRIGLSRTGLSRASS